jgi:hypothetical protein
MTGSVRVRQGAGLAQADLFAKTMNITADYGAGLVYVTAVCENLGPGDAQGPFIISVEVAFGPNGTETSYFENFEVPASVILHGGPPVAVDPTRLQADSAERSGSITSIGGPFQTSYVTGRMAVPLHFRDADPATFYTASFLVDSYYEVPDHDRANNQFTWPGDPTASPTFSFMSLAARERRGPFVIART